jgi:hypothetical protein
MFVPTVLFYLPDKDKSAHLIGKFDKPTILAHQEKFVTGKLPSFPMRTKARDIEIRDIVCPKVMPEVVAAASEEGDPEDKELEDEILKEILREDEERRKKREKEEADIKKRGGKGKKKKKKDKKKEDL